MIKRTKWIQDVCGTDKLRVAVIALYCITVVATLFLIVHYIPNIPNADDYDMYLRTVVDWGDASSLGEKFSLLFRFHGEHLIVTTRVVALIAAIFFGGINFTIVVLIGYLGVVLSSLILAREVRRDFGFRLAFTVALLVALPAYPQALTWAAASIEHLWVMTFVLLALVAGKRDSTSGYVCALFCGLIAAVTQGNGVFVLYAVGIEYLYRRKWAVGLLFLGGGFGLTYFLLSHAGDAHHVGVVDLVLRAPELILYSLYFIGSWATGFFWISMVVAVVTIGVSIYSYIKPLDSKWGVYRGVALFILLTSMANAVARSSFGIGYAHTQNRYFLPSIFGIVAAFILVQVAIEKRSLLTRRVTTLIAILIAIGTSCWHVKFVHSEFRQRNEELNDGFREYSLFHTSGLRYPDLGSASLLMDHAIRHRWYHPMSIGFEPLPSGEIRKGAVTVTSSPCRGVVERVEMFPQHFSIKGFVTCPRRAIFYPKNLLFVTGSDQATTFRLTHRSRPELLRRGDVAGKISTGFYLLARKIPLDDEPYKIFIELASSSSDNNIIIDGRRAFRP